MADRPPRRPRSHELQLRRTACSGICRHGVEEAVRAALFGFLPAERRPRPPRRLELPEARRLRAARAHAWPIRRANSLRAWRALLAGRPPGPVSGRRQFSRERRV